MSEGVMSSFVGLVASVLEELGFMKGLTGLFR